MLSHALSMSFLKTLCMHGVKTFRHEDELTLFHERSLKALAPGLGG